MIPDLSTLAIERPRRGAERAPGLLPLAVGAPLPLSRNTAPNKIERVDVTKAPQGDSAAPVLFLKAFCKELDPDYRGGGDGLKEGEINLPLGGRSGSRSSVKSLWADRVRTSMNHKVAQYAEETQKLDEQIYDEQRRIELYREAAYSRATSSTSSAQSASALAKRDETNRFEISKEVDQTWKVLVATRSAVQQLTSKAKARSEDTRSDDKRDARAKELAAVIDKLVSRFSMQTMLMDLVVDLCRGFLHDPLYTNNMLLNFAVVGNPGSGKSDMVGTLSKIIGRLGLLVHDEPVTAFRSDFVAEYEGQTATKTKRFLNSNLERVVFLDEAYALTKYTVNKDGTRGELDAYSGEAIAELIGFLTQRVGSTSFVAAGYQHEMMHDFLPSNQGMPSRLPFLVEMQDYTADQLADIYVGGVARALRVSQAAAQAYFKPNALTLLKQVVAAVLNALNDYTDHHAVALKDNTSSRDAASSAEPPARYDLLEGTFSAAARSMVTLANATAWMLSSSKDFALIGARESEKRLYIDASSIYHMLANTLQRSSGSSADRAIAQLDSILEQKGWFTNKPITDTRTTTIKTRAVKRREPFDSKVESSKQAKQARI